MAQPATTLGTPTEFADVMGRLRRRLRRVIRLDFPGPALTPSERELLMLVHRKDGIGVADAAEKLQVAPNTVSTLVASLRSSGLLDRRTAPLDRRAAQLHLTPNGQARVAGIRRRRDAALNLAFDQLPRPDREALLGSLPALEHLIDALGDIEVPP